MYANIDHGEPSSLSAVEETEAKGKVGIDWADLDSPSPHNI